MTPVVSVRRTLALKSGERPIRNPRRNEPRMLTMSVPAGKLGPNALDAQRAVRYLAPVPSAPPRQIRRRRVMALKSSDSDSLLSRHQALRSLLDRVDGHH